MASADHYALSVSENHSWLLQRQGGKRSPDKGSQLLLEPIESLKSLMFRSEPSNSECTSRNKAQFLGGSLYVIGPLPGCGWQLRITFFQHHTGQEDQPLARRYQHRRQALRWKPLSSIETVFREATRELRRKYVKSKRSFKNKGLLLDSKAPRRGFEPL